MKNQIDQADISQNRELGMDFNQKRQVFAAEILHSHCWNPDLPWSKMPRWVAGFPMIPMRWTGPQKNHRLFMSEKKEKHLAECDIIIYSWFMSIYPLVI